MKVDKLSHEKWNMNKQFPCKEISMVEVSYSIWYFKFWDNIGKIDSVSK